MERLEAFQSALPRPWTFALVRQVAGEENHGKVETLASPSLNARP